MPSRANFEEPDGFSEWGQPLDKHDYDRRTERFHAGDMARLLKKQKIATIEELKRALGADVDSTLFRKLETLDYLSSYSHRGRYYALSETARFDELGLWSFRSVWFSRHGGTCQRL